MNASKFLSENMQIIQVVVVVAVIAIVMYFFSSHIKSSAEGMMNTLEFSPVSTVESEQEYHSSEDPSIQGQYVQPVTHDDGISPVTFHGEDSTITPEDLLPVSGESDLEGSPDLLSKNFLTAGFSMGINTQASVNRNGNRQIRSDPIIPQNLNATPFSQSTSAPDMLRKRFDIGGAEC